MYWHSYFSSKWWRSGLRPFGCEYASAHKYTAFGLLPSQHAYWQLGPSLLEQADQKQGSYPSAEGACQPAESGGQSMLQAFAFL